MSETKLTAKALLNQMMTEHYQGAIAAKEKGQPVAWAASVSPQEIFEVFDIYLVYPENQGAAIGARRESQKLIEHAEGKGYSSDLCSYARVNFGYADIRHCEAENIPMPDLLICANNICTEIMKWYENLAKELKLPLIFFDCPYSLEMDQTENRVRYVADQFQDAIRQLEAFTGKPFDEEKFRKVQEISNENGRLWHSVIRLCQNKPSPLNGFDLFNYMATMVVNRGKEKGTELYKLMYDEFSAKIQSGQGPWKDREERFRVIWEGIACWPYLSDTFKTLKRYGINIVASSYFDGWGLTYEVGNLRSMAAAYDGLHLDRGIEFKVRQLVDWVRQYQCDGVIIHSNRSCKIMDFWNYEVQRQVEKITGKPVVIFDGDQTDPRAFSPAQFETRIQAFAETMEQYTTGS
ncbi:MAG: 2-hydroxyacyl-CoA dehydratase family protein [Clostridiales Family XIII bacterium]|jgi:benzoyl-CoA reductase/2-hydroxyglutaryl-CoA dehydratase subunit BcrC/BadD/HgdB|nr:2-hydroxyacyl-CoA dehydratase family protein [Clostridiales Family XIII bacterium]